MIEFKDGTTITHQEAADLMRAEPGGLITGRLIDWNGYRCAGGVLIGSTQDSHWPRHIERDSIPLWTSMVDTNNEFEGTMKERAEFMAQWFEALE